MSDDILSSPEIARLATLTEEAIRSTETGVKRFVEPAPGTLQQAKNRTHTIVFGRRGSGKSILLRKAAADLTADRPTAYVDLETFKGHSYPDVLLSVLIKTFEEFNTWLSAAAASPANITSILTKFLPHTQRKPSFDHKEAMRLSSEVQKRIEELKALLYSSDQAQIQRVTKQATDTSTEKQVDIGASKVISLGAKIAGSEASSQSQEVHESFQTTKIEFLHRHIMDYQAIFLDMAKLTHGDSYLFLDDLYYIRRVDQAKVIDYFHRIAKNNSLWLKIGTIRHRTDWYVHGDPIYGMKLGDDAQEINLDLTLENYESTKAFLLKILQALVTESGSIELDQIITEKALERLVLASGGVARDFLGIFRKSIAVAQNQLRTKKRSKISAEHVNSASGPYSFTKKEEFKKDTSDEDHATLEESFERVKNFCIQSKKNLFLIEKQEDSNGYEAIQELVDLRLIHKARSRVSISKRQGKTYEAYMLDVSQYTQFRKKRDFQEIPFWKPSETPNIRRLDLILDAQSLVEKPAPSHQPRPRHKSGPSDATGHDTRDSQTEQLQMFPTTPAPTNNS